jgi:AhpD family alkylhydroperoxidase
MKLSAKYILEPIMSAIPSYVDLTTNINTQLATFRKESPAAMKAFGELARAATQAGVLDEKTKELIAVAIAVATRCDGCIGFHVKALVRLGATREELNETLNMCIYLGGGPSLMYSANVLAAFDEFSQAANA